MIKQHLDLVFAPKITFAPPPLGPIGGGGASTVGGLIGRIDLSKPWGVSTC